MAPSSPDSSPPLAYRPGLDAVRAVAILLVIIGHWARPVFPISIMGSMTFFVLSGYFISGIVWKQAVYVGAPGAWPRRLGVFYLRRLVRTLPPYYLSLAVGFFLPLVTLRTYPVWFLIPVSNLLFYRLGHWAEGVGHYWTMAVDEQFYLLWPLLLAVVPRRLRWLALVAVGSLLFRILWSHWTHSALALALLPSCLDMFAVGGMLRIAEQLPLLRHLARPYWVIAAWLAWAALWAMLHVTESDYAWQLIYPSAGSIPAALTLNWALHQPTRPVSENRYSAAMRWLGQRSYGCYLYHLLLPVVYQRVIYKLFSSAENRQFWLTPLPTVLLLLPLLLLLAAASWRFLEAPLNWWKNRLAYSKQ